MAKSKRQLALEEFVNDDCVMVTQEVFTWRGNYYQVLPYKQIRKSGSKEDQFIKQQYYSYLFGIRELSDKLKAKLLLDK